MALAGDGLHHRPRNCSVKAEPEEARCCDEIRTPLALKLHWLPSNTTRCYLLEVLGQQHLQVSVIIRMYGPLARRWMVLLQVVACLEGVSKRPGFWVLAHSSSSFGVLYVHIQCIQQDI